MHSRHSASAGAGVEPGGRSPSLLAAAAEDRYEIDYITVVLPNVRANFHLQVRRPLLRMQAFLYVRFLCAGLRLPETLHLNKRELNRNLCLEFLATLVDMSFIYIHMQRLAPLHVRRGALS